MVLSIFYVAVLISPSCGQKSLGEEQMNELMQEMLSNYDMTKRAQIDKQLTVRVNFFVQGLSAIDEENMDYQISIFFRQVK